MQVDSETELETVRRVLAGERDAFVALVQSHQRLVERVVARLLDDPRDREEVAQDTFLRVHRGLAEFRGDAPLGAWIARIAHRTAVNRLNSRRVPGAVGRGAAEDDDDVVASLPAADPDPHELAAAGETRALLRREIAALPPVQRTVLTLYHLQEMAVGEIAAALELPANTVKSHLARARRKLKERLLERYTAEGL